MVARAASCAAAAVAAASANSEPSTHVRIVRLGMFVSFGGMGEGYRGPVVAPISPAGEPGNHGDLPPDTGRLGCSIIDYLDDHGEPLPDCRLADRHSLPGGCIMAASRAAAR
jgi:hypothetical protein